MKLHDLIKQLDQTIDLVCLEAAEIHNLGNYVSDSQAQQIINSIRSNLDDFKQQLINSQQGQGEAS